MGITKSDQFSPKVNQMAALTKAIGHPARVAILEYLLKVNSCICSDIVEELPLAQPTISQHLKELKEADLIKGNIEGKSICYCINEKAIHQLKQYFASMFEKLQAQNCC